MRAQVAPGETLVRADTSLESANITQFSSGNMMQLCPMRRRSPCRAPAHETHWQPCVFVLPCWLAHEPASSQSAIFILHIVIVASLPFIAVTAQTCELSLSSESPSGCRMSFPGDFSSHTQSPTTSSKSFPQHSSAQALTALFPSRRLILSHDSGNTHLSVTAGMCDVNDRQQVRK
jgi:hypothetical protein